MKAQHAGGFRTPVPRLVAAAASSAATTGPLSEVLQRIRADLDLSESFPDEVEAEAQRVASAVALPELDLETIPFVTIDPPGATDLDQAVHLERTPDGYTVHYAIADVPAFVPPDGAIDAAARARGQTVYAPDGRIPLHPTVISEGAASLLPDRVRSAYVWSFTLDSAAELIATTLVRARVRSRTQYSYRDVQTLLENGSADDSLILLREVGLKRIELERKRGGASLNRPDEEVAVVADGYVLTRRAPLPVEGWNAQISLMTGMAAARIMLDARIGILRTMPEPTKETIEIFRNRVAALGCPWPTGVRYGDFLRSLDHTTPPGLAATRAATTLFRGAGYTVFDGDLPEQTIQAALAAPYAHTTAPLRRLVDRFVLILCEAALSGSPVPQWLRAALPSIPGLMAHSDAVASQFERASVDVIEAALLSTRVGEVFDAIVISAKPETQGRSAKPETQGSAKPGTGSIQLSDPVVTATVEGSVVPGDTVRVQLVAADIATGAVRFVLV